MIKKFQHVSGSLILSYFGEKKSIRLKIEIIIINKTVVTAVTFSMLKVLYLLIYGQYKTTGRINPIIGLIVLPTKVIADPISGTNKAMQQFIVINRKVIRTF